MAGGEITVDDPRAEDVRSLLERHLAFTSAASPPEDCHALDVEGLLDGSVTLYTYRKAGELLAVGAIKELDAGHAELKSMHTAEAARRQGIGRMMLDHLVEVARGRGYQCVSLETGTMEAFAPAREMYASAGFEPCPPFGDYRASPNSTFMRLWLLSS